MFLSLDKYFKGDMDDLGDNPPFWLVWQQLTQSMGKLLQIRLSNHPLAKHSPYRIFLY